MDTLFDVSPYWLSDPTVADANLLVLCRGLFGVDSVDPAVAFTLPCCQVPVVMPAGAAPERARGDALWSLPFPYLPADVWMRRPGEHAGAYQMRLLVALDALGFLESDEDGVWFKDLEWAPKDERTAASYRLAFDGVSDDPAFTEACEHVKGLAAGVWSDGYPYGEQAGFARALAALSLDGSAVLAAQRALALASNGGDDMKHAMEILKRAKTVYGDGFASELTPDGVRTWLRGNVQRAIRMVDELARAGLEAEGMPAAFRQVLEAV